MTLSDSKSVAWGPDNISYLEVSYLKLNIIVYILYGMCFNVTHVHLLYVEFMLLDIDV